VTSAEMTHFYLLSFQRPAFWTITEPVINKHLQIKTIDYIEFIFEQVNRQSLLVTSHNSANLA
jgi:hypothetical protein